MPDVARQPGTRTAAGESSPIATYFHVVRTWTFSADDCAFSVETQFDFDYRHLTNAEKARSEFAAALGFGFAPAGPDLALRLAPRTPKARIYAGFPRLRGWDSNPQPFD